MISVIVAHCLFRTTLYSALHTRFLHHFALRVVSVSGAVYPSFTSVASADTHGQNRISYQADGVCFRVLKPALFFRSKTILHYHPDHEGGSGAYGQLLFTLRAQAFAAFGTTCTEHLTTALGGHAGSKPMGSFAM
jgi:hypothetical protein